MYFPVAEHLTAQHNAIKMLHSRVRLILDYIKAVQAGEVPRNHEVLREAYSLSHRLPVLSSDKFNEDFYNVSVTFHGRLCFYRGLINIKAVQAGEAPCNHEVLREAYSLSHRLPVLSSDKFNEDFYDVSLLGLVHRLVISLSTNLQKAIADVDNCRHSIARTYSSPC